MSDGEPAILTQWREALRWLAFAAKDLRVARSILDDETVVELAAFHVQQATEKILKALLVAAATDIRRIHDLDALATLAHRHWPDVIPMRLPLARASAWYVVTRYPGIDDVRLDAGDVAAAVGEAETLIAKAMQLVPPALQGENGVVPDGSAIDPGSESPS